ncbi:hypothetical protein CEXT_386241 [Caerostris extrusa]|uniref:Uncharacterized protein n=1 Tax=Caerostris extrusa TaxID=172846 RepID=A0AAV4P7X0_CAEEX|nr:hypothetical protein CEXT_386241 [Caerostris extrusa]
MLLADNSEKVVRGLKCVDEKATEPDVRIIYMLLNKVVPETRHLWSEKTDKSSYEPMARTNSSEYSLRMGCGRCVSETKEKISLHCFCDSSEQAYAAVIYCKQKFADRTSVNLLVSKTKIAPIKANFNPSSGVTRCNSTRFMITGCLERS